MRSIRKGLRAGEVEKDTYGRLECAECETALATEDDPDSLGKVRSCPDCGREWKALS